MGWPDQGAAHRAPEDRSRSRRHRHRRSNGAAPGVMDPVKLREDMGREAFLGFVAKVLNQVSAEEFHSIFHELPGVLQEVAYDVPTGIIVDVDSLEKEQRITMSTKINELRRRRCRLLSTPKARRYWEDENFTFVPMSRITCKHFWEVFRMLPLATTDDSSWKNAVKYLGSCPEAPLPQYDTDRRAARSDHAVDERERNRERTPARAAGRGMDKLHALAKASPGARSKAPGKPPSDRNSDEFAEWIHQRVEVDTARLTLSSLEVDVSKHKLRRKSKVSSVFDALPRASTLSDVHHNVYQIYLRKLGRLMSGLRLSTREGKDLQGLCDRLNLDLSGRNGLEDLPALLARFRSLDMVGGPM